jgi:MFS transporter, ACDE family, multidrug resistance protein
MEDPFTVILMGRVLQGVGSAGSAPVVISLIGDMFDKDITSGLGLIEAPNTAGKVLSPIIGALLASFIWLLPFWFIPFFSLISVLLVVFFVVGFIIMLFCSAFFFIFQTYWRKCIILRE